MIDKVYILGYVPKKMTPRMINKFNDISFYLKSKGYNVFNPIDNYLSPILTWEEAHKKNIRELMNCNSIFVTDDRAKNTEEMKLAISLKLIVISDVLQVNYNLRI